MTRHARRMITAVLCIAVAALADAESRYPLRPDDPQAVDLAGAVGDGIADDTEALQHAIDAVHDSGGQGILFVPEGRYRITKTIFVWPGVRVIGHGASRPVLVLADDTPGFGDPESEMRMLHFAGNRPGAPDRFGRPSDPNAPPRDASPGTFYSAISNVDVEIGAGNHGAVGVRGTYAQHCFLAHMDFRLESGIAGVHDTGNVMQDVRFFGGRYGLWTRTASPSWQITLVDVAFEGQGEAAIRETAAGLTLIRPRFRNVPTALTIDEDSYDDLWVKDARLENVSGPAFVISNEDLARAQVGMEDVVAVGVPTFALLRDSGRTFAGPSHVYEVDVFSHGLSYSDIHALGEARSRFETTALPAPPPPVPTDLAALPPMAEWVSIRSLGAHGDGETDDTDVIRAAVAAHRAIYFPQGYYVVSDSVVLRPDSVLIGLHPSTTQIALLDETPAFQGVGPPRGLIETPRGGSNVIVGLGVNTNGINPRAAGVIWRSGPSSTIDDVKFHGGHGTRGWDGSFQWPYNDNRTGDPDPQRRWDSQYPSLWVTDGGGGTFFDIWTASPFAQSGLLVSDTTTEGRVYAMSAEHHVRYEVQLHDVANWSLYAVQTEAERGESGFMLPFEISGSRDVTLANTHIYRVISSYQPFRSAVEVRDSSVRIRNMHSYTNSKAPYGATVRDLTHGAALAQPELAWLDVGRAPAPRPEPVRAVAEEGATLRKLADGFDNISGGAVDPAGDYYFVDRRWSRIYRWSPRSGLSVVLDAPIDPVNLAFDRSGNLMIVCYSGDGIVLALDPDAGARSLEKIEPVPAQARPGLIPIVPASSWSWSGEWPARPFHYLSPDGTSYIAADEAFVTGATSWGVKGTDLLRFGLAPASPGAPFYHSNDGMSVTYAMEVTPDGGVRNVRPFVQRGGESVTVDSAGDVYVTSGDVLAFDAEGRWIDTIDVPERATHIAFGGDDGHTLFIAARSALYSLRMRHSRR